MPYLQPTEYEQYGLDADTTDDWIAMATALIDAWCHRTSLLATQYVERMRLTANAQTVRLSYTIDKQPTVLTTVRVRYARPRRGEMPDPFREQIAWAFSLPGSWTALDVAGIDLNPATGELTFPENFLGLTYNEVEVTYTAGFAITPGPIKLACAQIVRNAQSMPSTSIKSSRMDTLQLQYFGGSYIDANIQALLGPYRAQRIG